MIYYIKFIIELFKAKKAENYSKVAFHYLKILLDLAIWVVRILRMLGII